MSLITFKRVQEKSREPREPFLDLPYMCRRTKVRFNYIYLELSIEMGSEKLQLGVYAKVKSYKYLNVNDVFATEISITVGEIYKSEYAIIYRMYLLVNSR
jgi:hypothetical protein